MDLFFKLKVTIKSSLLSSKEKFWMRSFSVFLLLLSVSAAAQDVFMQQKGARLLKAGEELMAQNQFAAARENFNEFLALSVPATADKQDAEYYRGICSLHL